MKKRKELDALLTMANGKKNGKSKRSKEGHELLRLNSDSNSSDNDELFLAPKKTVVRRPKQCQCCTMCVPLVMFILTTGCMVITGGLIWMHFNLKQDLDDLRTKLQKVELQAGSASSQENTIMDLESRLQRMSDIPEKVDTAAVRIHKLNESFHNLRGRQEECEKLKDRVDGLEGKASSTSTTELQQIANIGSEIQNLKTTSEENKNLLTSHNLQLTQLVDDVDTLKSQVAVLHPQTTHEGTTSSPATTTGAAVSPSKQPDVDGAGISAADTAKLMIVSEEISELWDAVRGLNGTVVSLSSQHSRLAATVAGLQPATSQSATGDTELPTTVPHQDIGTQPQSAQAGQYDLAQMKTDIDYLKAECNRSAGSLPVAAPPPNSSVTVNSTAVQWIAERVDRIEERFSELNPNDLNNNLLNPNTTLGIQTIMDSALAHFKAENLADVGAVRRNLTNLRLDTEEVGYRINSITDQIHKLQSKCQVCSMAVTATSGDLSASTAAEGTSPTTPMPPPLVDNPGQGNKTEIDEGSPP